MAPLVVVTGPPGAGKSTVAALVADAVEPGALVEGDSFFGFLGRGAVDPWLPEADPQNQVVLRAAASAVGSYARGGITTVYDGVLGPWSLPPFVAATAHAELHYLVLLPDEETCVTRVAARTGHGFTDAAATRHMHDQFASAALDPRHLVPEPTRPPDDLAAAVLTTVEAGTALIPPGTPRAS